MKNIYSVALNVFMACAWSIFAYANIKAFLQYHDIVFLLFTISQTEFAILVLLRKKAFVSSTSLTDYCVAFVGTFIILLYRPSSPLGSIRIIGDVCIYVAVTFEVFGFLALNRSAGIVPANRGVKTRGLYSYIRHPIYLGSMLLYVGYVLLSPSIANFLILIIGAIFQIMRIQREEKLLRKDIDYMGYTEKVKWRLIPFVY